MTAGGQPGPRSWGGCERLAPAYRIGYHPGAGGVESGRRAVGEGPVETDTGFYFLLPASLCHLPFHKLPRCPATVDPLTCLCWNWRRDAEAIFLDGRHDLRDPRRFRAVGHGLEDDATRLICLALSSGHEDGLLLCSQRQPTRQEAEARKVRSVPCRKGSGMALSNVKTGTVHPGRFIWPSGTHDWPEWRARCRTG